MAVGTLDELDAVWRALADRNRRAILRVIRTEPESVGAVAERVELSQQTTSHHLRTLRDAGLATETRKGTRHLYAANTDGLAAVRSYLDDFWPAKLTALKQVIEAKDEIERG